MRLTTLFLGVGLAPSWLMKVPQSHSIPLFSTALIFKFYCMYVHHEQGLEEGIGFLGPGVRGGY